MGTLSLHIAKILKGAKVQLFQGRKQNLYSFLFTLPKVAPLHPSFSLSIFRRKIRPHRFGGEGVLIGGQNSNTKCSMTFVNIAVAISALAGGGKNGFAPRPEYGGVFDIFRGFLGVWAQEGIEMEFWVILVAFRQWKNGQK